MLLEALPSLGNTELLLAPLYLIKVWLQAQWLSVGDADVTGSPPGFSCPRSRVPPVTKKPQPSAQTV